MSYKIEIGVWKTIKNGLIMFGPSIVAFIGNLPESIKVQYALPIGLVLYFIKNFIENRK